MAKQVGVDLMLPLAAILPFERHVRFAQAKQLPGKVAENLLDGAGSLAAVLLSSKVPMLKKLGPIGKVVGALILKGILEGATNLVGAKLRKINAEALAKRDCLTATLTRFQMDLEKAEGERKLLRRL